MDFFSVKIQLSGFFLSAQVLSALFPYGLFLVLLTIFITVERVFCSSFCEDLTLLYISCFFLLNWCLLNNYRLRFCFLSFVPLLITLAISKYYQIGI